jgi:hypothetical protein
VSVLENCVLFTVSDNGAGVVVGAAVGVGVSPDGTVFVGLGVGVAVGVDVIVGMFVGVLVGVTVDVGVSGGASPIT